MSKLKNDLLKKLKTSAKGPRTVYLSDDNWEWLVGWCESQKPPRKPSQMFEAFIETLREQETSK